MKAKTSSSEGRFAYEGLDRVIHERARHEFPPEGGGHATESKHKDSCEPGVKSHGEPQQWFIDCRHSGCLLRKRKK